MPDAEDRTGMDVSDNAIRLLPYPKCTCNVYADFVLMAVQPVRQQWIARSTCRPHTLEHINRLLEIPGVDHVEVRKIHL